MEKTEQKIKHLEFIQSNIERMNQCSHQMKGWMITIVTALLAVYASSINGENRSGNIVFIFIAVFPTIIFWFLDSFYLQQERKFRGIYNDIISDFDKTIVKVFSMPLNKYKGRHYCLLCVMFSKTEWPLYLTITVGLLLTGIFLSL